MFPIKYFFSKCDQIHRKLRIWSHLLKTSFMENFIFCAVPFLILALLTLYFSQKPWLRRPRFELTITIISSPCLLIDVFICLSISLCFSIVSSCNCNLFVIFFSFSSIPTDPFPFSSGFT